MSISPTIALGRFVNCKAHATLTRELGEDVEADLASMEAELIPLYRRTLLVELGQLSKLQDLVGVPGDNVDWSSVEGLTEYCVRSLDGHQEEDEPTPPRRRGRGKKKVTKRGAKKEAVEEEGSRKKKGPHKKGPRKKGPRRRG